VENSETCLEIILLTYRFLYFSVYFKHSPVFSLPSISYILMQYPGLCILMLGWRWSFKDSDLIFYHWVF